MTKNEKICELFKDTYSIDYVLEQMPDINVEYIIQLLIKEGLITSVPKKHYNAGVLTYVVSNMDLVPRITELLAEGYSRTAIFTKLHIGHTRLQKIIEEYNLLSVVNSDKQTNEITETVKQTSKEQEENREEKREEKFEEVSISAPTTEPVKESELLDKPQSDSTKSVESVEKSNKITDEYILEYAKEHLNLGETRTQIYTELHIAHRRLERILAANGIETNKKKRKVNTETSIETDNTNNVTELNNLNTSNQDVKAEKKGTSETKQATVHDFTKKTESLTKSSVDELKTMLGNTTAKGFDIILVERPKPSVVESTDADLQSKIKVLLSQGKSKKTICQDLHIGLNRLNELIADTEEKFEITSMLIAQYQACKSKGYSDKYTAEELRLTSTQIKAVSDLLKKTKLDKAVNESTDHIPTVEEKVVYANKTYGIGAWRFLTRQECLDLLIQDNLNKDIEDNVNNDDVEENADFLEEM